MVQRQERQSDRDRELKAMELWSQGNYEYYKLDPNDIDFKVRSKRTDVTAFIEVKGRNRTVDKAFPLPIAARKLVKLDDSRKQDKNATRAFIIWACTDGIIWCDLDELNGVARMGGRPQRPDTANDWEVMVYYNRNQAPFKTIINISEEDKL